MTANPCITCDSFAPCATCIPRLAFEGTRQPEPETHVCLTCIDAEWLALSGEAPEQIAARLGYRGAENLKSHLRKHGRTDILRRTA